jgi:hypothetical protein
LIQTVVGTRQPTHQIPINATTAIRLCPNPGSPKSVMYHIENKEAKPMRPQMTIFE